MTRYADKEFTHEQIEATLRLLQILRQFRNVPARRAEYYRLLDVAINRRANIPDQPSRTWDPMIQSKLSHG